MKNKRYSPQEIEKKWQKHWEEHETFKVDVEEGKPKYYVLDMFPYPSGSGLHVGHVEGYTATDIIARHKRQLGFNVLHPMGWDSFGLPAEQYAVRTGTHPSVTTKNNIDNFRKQLKRLGFCYDWDREFATSDPSYYKWTQWIFTKLYERGLAYEAEVLVNFCPALGTVLSNEEVIDGKSEVGGFPVERRPLKQWVLKITEYAQQLLDDLDDLDWPEHLKKLQRNWIGRSEGALIHFSCGQETIEVFTTRHDTLFGVTYMVLSPEHPLIERITLPSYRKAVDAYCEKALKKSDLDRTDLAKEKTGVFTGTYAQHPVTEEKIPVWVSDYVLMGYGTGAIMCVPAHDERDAEFAQKYNLPVRAVYEECLGSHKAIHSQHGDLSLNGLEIEEAKEKMAAWLEKHRKGEKKVNYKLRDWLFSRQRYWGEPFPILHFEDGSKRVLALDELPLSPPNLSDFKPAGDGRSPLAKVTEWVEIIDPVTGKKAQRETNTMPNWAGSCWYYLRFLDPHNDHEAFARNKEKYWMPIDLYVGGVEHAVLHLLYARFWHKVLFDCGLVSTKEPFQSLRNPGLIVARSFKTQEGSYIDPQEVDLNGEEYRHKRTGEVLISQIEKMSKSKLNGVSPDEIIEEFGADALRLYEMFMGPLEKEKVWNTDAVHGCKRFLSRFYELTISEKLSDSYSEEAMRLAHILCEGVKHDYAILQFNTAIAKFMEFVNHYSKLEMYTTETLKMATIALMPMAPHLAQECYEILGGIGELFHVPYPSINKKYLQQESVTYVVQVNGKLRGRFDLPKDQSEEILVDLAKKHESICRHLDGKEISKVIFIPNKLLNFVVHEG